MKSQYSRAQVIAIGERVRTLRRRAHLTQVELAKRAEVSVSWVSKVELGITGVARTGVEGLARGLGCRPEDLDGVAGGETAAWTAAKPARCPGSAAAPDTSAAAVSPPVHDAAADYTARRPAAARPRPPPRWIELPVLGKAHCAEHRYAPHQLAALTAADWDGETILVRAPAYGLFALVAEGDSMEPRIEDGDILVVDLVAGLLGAAGRIAVVVAQDEHGHEQCLCKRVVAIEPALRLATFTANAPVRELPLARVKYVWPVVEIRHRQELAQP